MASVLVQAMARPSPSPSPTPSPSRSRKIGFDFEIESLSCSSMVEVKQFQSQIIRRGLSIDNDAMGRLIKFCALSKNGDLDYGLLLFNSIPFPDTFIYNTLIRAYLNRQSLFSSILLYIQMLHHSLLPNKFTFPSLIRSSISIHHCKQFHAHLLKFGFASDTFSLNNLIHMYLHFNSLDEARLVFYAIPFPDVVSWTTLLTGYAHFGFLDQAFQLFDSMPDKNNSASWNAMLSSFVQNNRFHHAFALFHRMRANNIVFDKYVAASMLSACTGLGALEQGKWIHRYIVKTGIELDSKLATTLIDMYCKCGCLETAFQVFSHLQLPQKGISSWNCMIGGMAMHGRGEAAIQLFREMEMKMVTPDHITFLNILSACAHSGLVEQGQHYFRHFNKVYGIEPRTEHFGCMVDLLGRAGMIEKAMELISEMPMNPDVGVLGALVGACKIHGKIELGVEVGKRVIEMEPNNSGRYVLLGNLYAKAGRWEGVADVRKLMNDREVKKVAGVSMIEMEGTVYEFIAGGRVHPEAKEIYAKLNDMLECIRSQGYVPETEIEFENDGESDKDNPVYYHSEKLAIAFALIKTKAGETLRITKNLRICKDCHQAMKLVSKVYDRKIIVRDRNRFHHFSCGECSCNDYW